MMNRIDIKRLREAKGWTLEEMGRELGGTSHSTISRWENGVSRPRGIAAKALRDLYKEVFNHLPPPVTEEERAA